MSISRRMFGPHLALVLSQSSTVYLCAHVNANMWLPHPDCVINHVTDFFLCVYTIYGILVMVLKNTDTARDWALLSLKVCLMLFYPLWLPNFYTVFITSIFYQWIHAVYNLWGFMLFTQHDSQIHPSWV